MSQPATQLLDQVRDTFAAQFGRASRCLVAAPGRVNLIGEHTDYNDGYVLPMAIGRFTVVAAARNDSPRVCVHSLATRETVAIDLQAPIQPVALHWSNYVRGVLAGFQRLGVTIPGFDAVIGSDVPLGGGLSSSAALEVAIATLLEALTGHLLEPVQKAVLCQKAEHEFAGVPCGIMDQLVVTSGRADSLLLLDCRSHEMEFIPFVDPTVVVLIINSQVKHELSASEYQLRRAECESAAKALAVASLRDVTSSALNACESALPPKTFRHARHVVSEIERTVQAAEQIRARHWSAAGKLMYASHASLRDDLAVSCRELDLLVELAQELGEAGGVYGSRLTGGGFGGCTVSLVEAKRAEAIAQRLCARYESATGIRPAAFVTRPAGGAVILPDLG